MALSLQDSRAGVSLPLTNLVQGYTQPDLVMRLLFPLAETGAYGGTTVQFDDSTYDEVDDTRDDDTSYPEVEWGYSGQPYKLNTKGLSWRLGDKKRAEMDNLNLNWGQIGSDMLMGKAGLKHEIEAATIATNPALYATTNRITISGGDQWNNADTDPDPIIRRGRSAVADQCGREPQVAVIGRYVFDSLASKYSGNFTSVGTNPGVKPQLTLQTLAQIYGFQQIEICDAIVKRGGVKTKLFGNHMVMGVVNPAAINGNRLPYRPNGQINAITPSYGYTYVYRNNPLMYQPYYDNDRSATVYKLDFDRKVVVTGKDEQSNLITFGYLIANAVANP
ncbi:MAG: hypothetical protein WCA35_06975 [Kovacikia sp.]